MRVIQIVFELEEGFDTCENNHIQNGQGHRWSIFWNVCSGVSFAYDTWGTLCAPSEFLLESANNCGYKDIAVESPAIIFGKACGIQEIAKA